VENALELGREIFALPGRITDPLGYGCNRLIREGAMVLTCPEDVLEYLGLSQGTSSGPLSFRAPDGLSEDEKKILSLLGPDPVHMDEITFRSGFSSGTVSLLLSALETGGAVRSVGNARYVKRYR